MVKAKIIIYDSPMYCTTSVCVLNPDQTLVNFQDTTEKVQALGVERYIITQSPEKFKENPAVIKLIQEYQLKALPITDSNGKIVKTGSYLILEEFKKFIKETKL